MKKLLSLFVILILATPFVLADDSEYLSQKWVYTSKAGVSYVEAEDLDGDGVKEIVAGSSQMMMGGAAGWINVIDKDKNCQGEYVLPGYLAGMTVSDLKGDGESEIIAGVFSRIHVVDSQADKKWDMTAKYGYDISYITTSDVNSDGENELLVGAGSGSMHNEFFVISADGKPIWSVRANGEINSIEAADLDGDGVKELFVGTYGRQSTYTTKAVLQVFNNSGKLRLSYPTERGVSAIAVSDIDADGESEILAGTYEDLFVLDSEGNDLWSYSTKGLIRKIIVSDIDADGENEIVLGSNDAYVLDSKGELKWSHAVGPEVYSLKLADLNKDGKQEVLAGCSDGGYIMESSGDLLWEFSANTVKGLTAADLEGDGYEEIIFGTGDKKVYVFQSETYAKEQEAYAKYEQAEASYNKKDYINAIDLAQDAKELYEELENAAGIKEVDALISKIESESRRQNQERSLADGYYNQSLSYYISGDYVDASTYAEKARYKYLYLKDTEAVAECEDILDKSGQYIELTSDEYLENASESYAARRYAEAVNYSELAWKSFDYLEDDNKTLESTKLLARAYYALAEERAMAKDFGNASTYAQKALYLFNCLGSGSSCDPSHAQIKNISELAGSLEEETYEDKVYKAELLDVKALLGRINREETGSMFESLGKTLGDNILYILVFGLVMIVFALLAGSLYLISKRQPKEKAPGLMTLDPRENVEMRSEVEKEPEPVKVPDMGIKESTSNVPKVRRDNLRGTGLAIKKTMRES